MKFLKSKTRWLLEFWMFGSNVGLKVVAASEDVIAVRTLAVLRLMGSDVVPSVTDRLATMETTV